MASSGSGTILFLVAALVTAVVLVPVDGGVLFSSLRRSLVIEASPKPGDVLKAGEDKIEVTLALNQTFSSHIDRYKTVNVKLCYAPVSQENRGWRKTNDDLDKDKTCQIDIASVPFTAASSKAEWVIGRDTPTATYFVRAYVMDSARRQLGYGQTTDASKSRNLIRIQGISGRQLWIDIVAGCFSALSVISLLGFFAMEKRMTKKS
ncbi:unnamed protein product [Victoria cruziana]